MLFNSYAFLLAFFPVAMIGYYSLNKLKKDVPAKLFLTGMSFCF